MVKNRLLTVQGCGTLTGLNVQVTLRKIQSGEIRPAWEWRQNELKQYEKDKTSTRELYLYENDVRAYVQQRPNNQFVLCPVGESYDDPGQDAGLPIPFSIAASRLGMTYSQLQGAAARGEIDRWAYTASGVYMRRYRADEQEEPTTGRQPMTGRSVYVFERDIEKYQQVRQGEEAKRHHQLTQEEEAQARQIAIKQIAEFGHVIVSDIMAEMGKTHGNTFFRRGVHQLAKKEGWTVRERQKRNP